MKAGGKAYRVFARVQGAEEWFEVGEVASTPESPDAACTLHKRLALEYAVDLYPKLKSKAKQLELGYSAGGQGDDDIVLVKKDVNDAIQKDAHGFLPKQAGPKMGQGLFNINGDSVPISAGKPAFAPGGKGATINPLDQQGG